MGQRQRARCEVFDRPLTCDRARFVELHKPWDAIGSARLAADT